MRTEIEKGNSLGTVAAWNDEMNRRMAALEWAMRLVVEHQGKHASHLRAPEMITAALPLAKWVLEGTRGIDLLDLQAGGAAGAEAGALLHELLGELSKDGDAAAAFKEHYEIAFADFVSIGGDVGEALDFMLEFKQGQDDADEEDET